LSSLAWPKQTPRSSSWKSRNRACSVSDEAVHASGRACARSNPGRRDRHADRGPHRVSASADTADKLPIPRAQRANRPRKTTVRKAAARRPQTLFREPVVRSTKIKQQVRTAPARRGPAPGARSERPRMETRVPRQRAPGNGRAHEDAAVVDAWRAAPMEPLTNLPVEPVAARDHPRRRR